MTRRFLNPWSSLTGLVLLSMGLVVGATIASTSPVVASPRGLAPLVAMGDLNRVDGLTVEELDDGTTTLRFQGNAEPTYNVYRLTNPDRLVIDLSGSRRGKVVPRVPLDTWAAGNVSVADVEEAGAQLVRVTVQLKREASYIVVPDRNDLVVTVTPREVPPEAYFARKSAGQRRAEIERDSRRAREMRAEASAIRKQASSEAREARVRAEAARQAEVRARTDEAAAREHLASSTRGKSKIRKALRAAEAERKRAEGARRKADQALAEALARAAAKEKSAKAANASAHKKLRDAERKQSKAAKALARAERDRKAAERTRKDAERAAANHRLSRKARKKLEEVRGAEKTARSRKAQAERELAVARRQMEQERAAVDALKAAAKVDRDAAKVARNAAKEDRDAAKEDRDSAAQTRRHAKEVLARAGEAMKQAEAEKEAAQQARIAAERALVRAKTASRRAKKSGQTQREEIDRALAQAGQAEKAARERQSQAESTLTDLKRDRTALARKLEEQKRINAQLLAIKAKQRTAAANQAEASRKKKEAQARQGQAIKARRDALTRREQAIKARRDALARREQATREKRAALERREQATQRRQRALARAEKESARKQERLARREQETAKKQAKLARGEQETAERQAKLARREQQSAQTAEGLARREQQNAGKAQTLARQQAALAEKQARAMKAEQAKLAKVRTQLEAEASRLEKVKADVTRTQNQLDDKLALAKKSGGLAQQWNKERSKAGQTRIKNVRFEDGVNEERVVVDVEGPIEFEGASLTPSVQMLKLVGAKISGSLERSLDASDFDGPVKMITSFAEGDDVKILVSTRDAIRPKLEEKPGQLVWRFPRKKPKAKPRATSDVVSMAGSKVGGFATPRRPLAAMAPNSGGPSKPGRRGKWRGERIDIELQEAPVKDVLLLFSDIGRVNIIAGGGVGGKVTMKLTAVPWDQALDIILRSLKLGMVREGNVIRVATAEAIEEERRKAIADAASRVQLKPLETRLVPVSYATAQEMIPKVQSVLSPRGSVTPDTRTNTLIIMDVAESIALAEQLVGQLDSQTPQVLIEARIVEARTNFLRQLGIQWGFGFIASPGTGNPTGLLFPNSLAVGGGATGQPSDARGLLLPGAAGNPNYAVDLPAPVGTGAGGAVGFSFGNISGNLQTNLRLSAAEDTGEVRIISAPKIVTLDNNEAQIEQGVQIPISQVSATGVNTRYVNATLALRVTPHVTNEGAVLLEVHVQKNEADFINTGARGDPTILTKQARSRMLVNDGDTAVIGGIYTRNKSVNFKKIPWIADIPIIGWFFKNKSEADTRTEVLIFLTPRIVNRASSIGG